MTNPFQRQAPPAAQNDPTLNIGKQQGPSGSGQGTIRDVTVEEARRMEQAASPAQPLASQVPAQPLSSTVRSQPVAQQQQMPPHQPGQQQAPQLNFNTESANVRTAGPDRNSHTLNIRDVPTGIQTPGQQQHILNPGPGVSDQQQGLRPPDPQIRDAPPHAEPGSRFDPAAFQGQPAPTPQGVSPHMEQAQQQAQDQFGAPAVVQQAHPDALPNQPLLANSALAPQAAPPAPVAAPASSGKALPDVAALISTLSRQSYLRFQFDALGSASAFPGSVWVLVNADGQSAQDEETLNSVEVQTVRVKQNLGPWFRFTLANDIPAEYILILDDDCVPGDKWLESALDRLKKAASVEEFALVCCGGRVFTDANDPSKFTEYGPENPNATEQIVDEGVKGWLFHRSLIEIFLAYPRTSSLVGWGMHFSAACQEQGIPTILLPCDNEDPAQWGHIPVAPGPSLSTTLPNYAEARTEAFRHYRTSEEGQPVWDLVNFPSVTKAVEEPVVKTTPSEPDKED